MRSTLAATALLPLALLAGCSTTSTSSDGPSKAAPSSGLATSSSASASGGSDGSATSSADSSSAGTSSTSSSGPASSTGASSASSASVGGGNRDGVFTKMLSHIGNGALTKDTATAKKNAHTVCSDMKGGAKLLAEGDKVGKMYPSLGQFEKGEFIGLSVGAYCPDQLSKIKSAAQ